MGLAQIGSVFEYVNQKPVFGVLGSDSVFYAPVLGFFVFTGIPTAVSCFLCVVICMPGSFQNLLG